MTTSASILLGINVDHVATLRQARGTDYPDPLAAARAAESGGADSITIHLREDRRHIQDDDVRRMQAGIATHLNLEMAVTDEMLGIAERVRPADCCLVPERRAELTTEGGLDVAAAAGRVAPACRRLAAAGIRVALFIDPEAEQVEAARDCGASVIELHTGRYADAQDGAAEAELERLRIAARHGQRLGLEIHAGHGLTLGNVGPVAAIPSIVELNIGHSIVARAIFVGMAGAVAEMKAAMQAARG